VEFKCAGCGCIVDRGVRIQSCGTTSCCCLHLPTQETVRIGEQLRDAINIRDIDTFRSLLSPDATWGDDPESDRYCHSRDQIIANYKRLLDDGVTGRVVETSTGPKGVACLLEVEWPDPENQGRGPRFYQVFLVTDRLVVHIEGHDQESVAQAAISN